MADDHLIRLRGAWERLTDREGEAVGRLDLPTTWAVEPGRALVLARRFGRPRLDDRVESLWLRLEDVPGLERVWLNGQLIGSDEPRAGAVELPLDESLPSRNRLVLEVNAAGAAGHPGWGAIALVIRPKG